MRNVNYREHVQDLKGNEHIVSAGRGVHIDMNPSTTLTMRVVSMPDRNGFTLRRRSETVVCEVQVERMTEESYGTKRVSTLLAASEEKVAKKLDEPYFVRPVKYLIHCVQANVSVTTRLPS